MTQHGMHLKTEFKKNVPYLFDQNGVDISIVATQSYFHIFQTYPNIHKQVQSAQVNVDGPAFVRVVI